MSDSAFLQQPRINVRDFHSDSVLTVGTGLPNACSTAVTAPNNSSGADNEPQTFAPMKISC